ncbi:hypothetical protein [Mycolicibacterium celeriflavum]|uniref:hypothetical protein n=1 Tax=Mycolicibacterium celeriflavum TaxID=1249101 RepID=UPI000AA5CEEA|nr:hypothetical protein [Mycolicibacterium celeriflavum]
MITGMQLSGDVLEQAEAIVEAEWIRLQRPDAAHVDRISLPAAELPVPQRSSMRRVVSTATLRRFAAPVGDLHTGLGSRQARLRPWATERSPPGG